MLELASDDGEEGEEELGKGEGEEKEWVEEDVEFISGGLGGIWGGKEEGEKEELSEEKSNRFG